MAIGRAAGRGVAGFAASLHTLRFLSCCCCCWSYLLYFLFAGRDFGAFHEFFKSFFVFGILYLVFVFLGFSLFVSLGLSKFS